MWVFADMAALVALLGAAATLTGRLLAAFLRVPLLRRPGPESLFASAFLGTAFLGLAYGWGSYCGLPARPCLLLVASLLTTMALVLAVRGRLREALRLPRPSLTLLAVALCLGTRVGVSLLPLLLARGYCPFNDAGLYIAAGDWLQYHGFGPAFRPDPYQPAEFLVHDQFQFTGHRMGPMFLLALMKAALPARGVAELFPPVLAWGAALNVGGIYVLCRWALRVPPFFAVAGTFLVSIALNSLALATATGHLCQVYGTAALAFALALLGRCLAPARWRSGHAAALGLSAAGLLSLYSELMPVFALAAAGSALATVLRATRAGRAGAFARFLGLSLASMVVFGNVECLRAPRALLFMSQARVGQHVPWGDGEFLLFALGFSPRGVTLDTPRGVPAGAGVLSLFVFLAGVTAVGRRRQALPLALGLVAFAGLAASFRFFARDPWTGGVGQSWSLFKISLWVVTVVSAVEAAGLALLLRRLPGKRVATAALCAGFAWAAVSLNLREAWRGIDWFASEMESKISLRELTGLRRRLDELNPRYLYLVSEPAGPWPRVFPALYLYPRPFVNGWKGSETLEAAPLLEDKPEFNSDDTLFFQFGRPPFEPPKESLPFGYSVVDAGRPVIFRAATEGGLYDAGGDRLGVGDRPLLLDVFWRPGGEAWLSFEATADPSRPGPSPRTLRLKEASGRTREVTVEARAGAVVRLPVTLPAGVSRLEFVCPALPGAPAVDKGVFPVALGKAKLEPAE